MVSRRNLKASDRAQSRQFNNKFVKTILNKNKEKRWKTITLSLSPLLAIILPQGWPMTIIQDIEIFCRNTTPNPISSNKSKAFGLIGCSQGKTNQPYQPFQYQICKKLLFFFPFSTHPLTNWQASRICLSSVKAN